MDRREEGNRDKAIHHNSSAAEHRELLVADVGHRNSTKPVANAAIRESRGIRRTHLSIRTRYDWSALGPIASA
jgi:plasmid stability protein